MNDLPREPLVVAFLGKQRLLGRVAEGQMPHVVAQRCDPQHGPPILVLGPAVLRDHVAHRVVDLVGPGDHVEDPAGHLHNPSECSKRLCDAPG